MNLTYRLLEKKVIITVKNRMCETADEILSSALFQAVLEQCVDHLKQKNSILLGVMKDNRVTPENTATLMQVLQFLLKMPIELIPNLVKGSDYLLTNRQVLMDFVEYVYNFWRNFDRYVICDSEGDVLDKRPYRTFNHTIESLTHLIRQAYRDIEENISGCHPRIYRQVAAGAEISAIALPQPNHLDSPLYREIAKIPVIRQVLLYPPLVINTRSNKRSGKFEAVEHNPLERMTINKDEWLCYPAKVGSLVIHIYFHQCFFELGFSLCNLFELADNRDMEHKPDAIFFYGVQGDSLDHYDRFPTVFYEDREQDMLVGAVPGRPEFAYFGYLKKMVLTLHNIRKMKSGVMPFHGALVKIILKGNREVVVLLMGDTGAGKSETLEAFRLLGESHIQDLVIIADDMGSLQIDAMGSVIGYGTEIGAFLRLDDLQSGFAFGQIDRTIIINPSQVNARIILPVTSFETLIRGHRVDYILYANNYEDIDEDHPIVQQFGSPEQAIGVFRDGAVMSKGTTTLTGLVHTYFANIFGPVQYRGIHDELAARYFRQFFESGIYVGQLRTRLGVPGYESRGPEEAASALIRLFEN